MGLTLCTTERCACAWNHSNCNQTFGNCWLRNAAGVWMLGDFISLRNCLICISKSKNNFFLFSNYGKTHDFEGKIFQCPLRGGQIFIQSNRRTRTFFPCPRGGPECFSNNFLSKKLSTPLVHFVEIINLIYSLIYQYMYHKHTLVDQIGLNWFKFF